MSRDEIINDLMRRRPQGPVGINITYTMRDGEYCYRSGNYKQIPVPSTHGYGYDDETLFSLGFKDRSSVREYIRQRDFEGRSDWSLGRKKATLNRRTNKVWDRIEGAIYRVARKGGTGIYSISEYHGRQNIANLFARSLEEAKESAKLFFGYLVSDSSDLRVKFVKIGTVDDVTALNAKTSENLQHRVNSCKKEIEIQTNRMRQLEAMMSTLQTVESQQIAVESIAKMDKLEEEIKLRAAC